MFPSCWTHWKELEVNALPQNNKIVRASGTKTPEKWQAFIFPCLVSGDSICYPYLVAVVFKLGMGMGMCGGKKEGGIGQFIKVETFFR